MRTGPRVLPRQIYSQQHDLTLWGLLLLDLPTLVSGLLLGGSLLLAGFVAGLGYVPVYVGRIVFTDSEAFWVLLLAGGIFLLAGPTLAWRINHFRRILRFAVLAPGQISRISTTPFEFRVEYVYWFQQQSYTARNAIRRHRQRERRLSLRPGRAITILVNEFQPEASVTLELYSHRSQQEL